MLECMHLLNADGESCSERREGTYVESKSSVPENVIISIESLRYLFRLEYVVEGVDVCVSSTVGGQ